MELLAFEMGFMKFSTFYLMLEAVMKFNISLLFIAEVRFFHSEI